MTTLKEYLRGETSVLASLGDLTPWQELTGPLLTAQISIGTQLLAVKSSLDELTRHAQGEKGRALARLKSETRCLTWGNDVLARDISALIAQQKAAGKLWALILIRQALSGDADSIARWQELAQGPEPDALAVQVCSILARLNVLLSAVAQLLDDVTRLAAPSLIAGAECALAPPRASLVGSLDSHAPPRASRSGAPGLVQSLRNAPERNDA